jgi:hypothetical protein
LIAAGNAQRLGIQSGNDRQKTVGIFCRDGSKVGQGPNENSLGQTTEADCKKCGQITVGQEGQGKEETVSHYERGQKSGNLCEMLNGRAAN